MKRQRVGIACDKCRDLKAKVRAGTPLTILSALIAYPSDFSVMEDNLRRRGSQIGPVGTDGTQRHSPALAADVSARGGVPGLSRAVDSYESLIQEFRSCLDGARQSALDASLGEIRRHIPHQAQQRSQEATVATPPAHDSPVASSPTYVGKASDIHFIHSIRQCVQGPTEPAGEAAQNYSQTHSPESLTLFKHPVLFPSPSEAEQFLDVYLSTIHVAYPFISKSVLLEAFQRFQAGDINKPEFRPWLALFSFIFAIGSYYTSFPHSKDSGNQYHFRYHDQGVYFSGELSADCSLMSIWTLLVQCFFLLAVCHTDRCWNILGFAIRMGQSIGLHVESFPSIADRPHWRRTWYAMYVLDRLLALQLGRPMAIHEVDFQVELPSLGDQSAFLPSGHSEDSQVGPVAHSQKMSYFLEVIRFSHIVGQVIQMLYRPSQIDLSPDNMLHSASSLDQRLLEWKVSLPRHLRFDMGHTFEKSMSFKRQRNMLAVKFHHLRALIHRPFLCLPLLQMNNQSFMNLLIQDKERISQAESICVHEAQETAHLLHNVVDERSLVHDFPWWQMISCLICASSILFVAESFYNNNNPAHSKTSSQSLREDAGTCLKVFEALSSNSAAARKAADILQGLSQMRRSTEEGISI
ncbi:hypothetical protein N7507_005925 [Penicillium longicatenatum]|nr:hypothetical protein N7507_005925 [Penicillium longicatenatum]